MTPWKKPEPTAPSTRPAATFAPRRGSGPGCGPGGGMPRSGGSTKAPSRSTRATCSANSAACCSPRPMPVAALFAASSSGSTTPARRGQGRPGWPWQLQARRDGVRTESAGPKGSAPPIPSEHVRGPEVRFLPPDPGGLPERRFQRPPNRAAGRSCGHRDRLRRPRRAVAGPAAARRPHRVQLHPVGPCGAPTAQDPRPDEVARTAGRPGPEGQPADPRGGAGLPRGGLPARVRQGRRARPVLPPELRDTERRAGPARAAWPLRVLPAPADSRRGGLR